MSRPLTDRDRAFRAKLDRLADRDEPRIAGGPRRIEIAGTIEARKSRSWQFFDGVKRVYIPDQFIDRQDGGAIDVGQTAEFLIPEWLCKKEGLI